MIEFQWSRQLTNINDTLECAVPAWEGSTKKWALVLNSYLPPNSACRRTDSAPPQYLGPDPTHPDSYELRSERLPAIPHSRSPFPFLLPSLLFKRMEHTSYSADTDLTYATGKIGKPSVQRRLVHRVGRSRIVDERHRLLVVPMKRTETAFGIPLIWVPESSRPPSSVLCLLRRFPHSGPCASSLSASLRRIPDAI